MIVNMHKAKTNLSSLVERAMAGEEIVLAKAGKPRVKLVPVDAKPKKRTPGRWLGKLTVPDSFFDPLPDEELAGWEGR
jgi:prevent-host-death family protein